jgi:methionine-R-sulfoxide reductase
MRTMAIFGLLAAFVLGGCETKSVAPAPTKAIAAPAPAPSTPVTEKDDKMNLSEAEWKQKLSPEQYRVLREKGTERPFSGKYWDTTTPGVYKCAGCGTVLFEAGSKFDAGCGWPSFDKMIAAGVIEEHVDKSLGMERREVVCAKCGGHLGHVFDDGPTSTGLRYCINSASIELEPKDTTGKADKK